MEKKEYREIDIPSLIRFVREKEGMTQKEFAETFGFKESSPSMWELGKREAPYKILEFVFSRWLEQELDKAREEGFVSGYVEANGDCNMLLKWKSYKQPKRTQVQAIKTTEEKQEKYLKKYIKLKQ